MVKRNWHWGLLLAAVWVFWWAALSSAVWDSPTMDEQNHLARGTAYVFTGDPRLSMEHPPLVNGWSALPLRTMDDELTLPLSHPSWTDREPIMTFWYTFADQFMWRMGNDVTRMVFLARVQVMLLTLILAAVTGRLAAAIWHRPSAAVWAAVFVLLDPNIIAHGRYVTTDLGGTLGMVAATAGIWWMEQRPSWMRGAAAALLVGAALSAKLSAVLFIPIWIGLVAWHNGRRGVVRLAAVGTAALLVVYAVFLGEWGPFLFIDQRLTWLNQYSGPMPTFWAGVERIALLSGGGRNSFLLGRFSDDGFWYYFPVAFAAKTPLIVPAGLLWAAWSLWGRRDALWAAGPLVGYFTLTLLSGLNLGYRHLLPILPFVYILSAGAVVHASKWGRWAGGTLTAGLLAAILLIHPHYVSFFNPLFGGPDNGYHVLVDSNVDWGQDLLRLRRWMDETDTAELSLSWFGTADPAYYGIDYQPLPGLPRHFNLWWQMPFDPADPPPGVYAISATNLWELPLRPEEKTRLAWFRQRSPDERIGYSILIYRVPAPAE